MAFRALLKSSATTLMTTAAVTALGFVSSVITARLLGPEGRGLLSGALLVAMLAANASLCGLANSFVYHKGAGKVFHYRAFLLLSLLFVMGCSVLLAWLGMRLTGEAQLHAELPLILLMTLVSAGQGYFYALSQLHERLRFFNLMRLLLVAGNLALLLALVLLLERVGFRDILLAQIAVSGLLTLLGLFWAKRHAVWEGVAPDGARAGWKSVLGYGLSHHGTVLLSLILVNFDKIALLKLGTIVEYGYYALAFTTSRLIGAVQEAAATALYARFAGRDAGELSHHVRVAFRLTFVPLLLLAALGAALSPWLIDRVYGAAFAAMALPFSILLFECVITGAGWMLAQRFNAGGRPGLVFVRQCVSVVPVFVALPFLPERDIHVHLSALMLFGAVLRLSVTLGLYPLALKERIPDLLPTASDCMAAFRLFTRRSYG